MILYNVTVKIDPSIESDWVEWMKTVHIPDVMKTGLFKEYKLCRLLYLEETDGVTFAVQYLCKNMETLERYQKEFAKELQRDHTERYKNKYVAFRTLMEVLDNK